MPFWGADRLTDDELRELIAFVAEEGMASGNGEAVTIGMPGAYASTHVTVGHVTELSAIFHGVRSTATIVNDCTIRIDDFFFDGNGIDVCIYAGLGGDYNECFAITGNLFNFPTGYSGATIYAMLPECRLLDDLDGLSVWCVTSKVDFGSGMFAAP